MLGGEEFLTFDDSMKKFKDNIDLVSPVNGYRNLAIFFYDEIINILIQQDKNLYQFSFKTHFCNGVYGVGKTKFGHTLENKDGYLDEAETRSKIWENIKKIIDDIDPQEKKKNSDRLKHEFNLLKNGESKSLFSFLFIHGQKNIELDDYSFESVFKILFYKLMGFFFCFFFFQSLFMLIHYFFHQFSIHNNLRLHETIEEICS